MRVGRDHVAPAVDTLVLAAVVVRAVTRSASDPARPTSSRGLPA